MELYVSLLLVKVYIYVEKWLSLTWTLVECKCDSYVLPANISTFLRDAEYIKIGERSEEGFNYKNYNQTKSLRYNLQIKL